MSQVNIEGLISTIRDTNVYTALVEALNNSIQSVESSGRRDGKIRIELIRSTPSLGIILDGEDSESSLPDITSIAITDNGEGFTDHNLESFDEAYTQNKIAIGGKGFGRFVYLKHFNDAEIESVYASPNGYSRRTFQLGKKNDIVYNLETSHDIESEDTCTRLLLKAIKDGSLDKKAGTVARKLLERILVHFTRENVIIPEIRIIDDYTGEADIVLNELLGDSSYAEIQQLEADSFAIEAGELYEFKVDIFKVWFPGVQTSKISLASNNLEVTEVNLSDHINEFESGFVGKFENRKGQTSNRFILKVYVTGVYLDEKVDRERVSFSFGKKSDNFNAIGKSEIESAAADVIRSRFSDQFQTERSKKRERLETVTNSKVWLKKYENAIDLSGLKVGAKDEDYEIALELARIKKDQELSLDVEDLVNNDTHKLTEERTEELIEMISLSNKEDLARYVAKRKAVLDIFDLSMKTNTTGKHSTEKVMHDIIYPTKNNTDTVSDQFQNLWIIDERLNFTEFVASDQRLSKENTDRPDLIAFHQQTAFRAGDERQNPITIVEFKRPGRDDFASVTSKENPISQIKRYTNDIKAGKYTAPGGRPIHTDQNTQFYGYIVVEFTEKVKKWLHSEEDFISMPDGLGYFKNINNINLYIEVLSWDKILKDAQLRNRIFIQKLGF